METLILVMSILCFMHGLFWLVADVTGPLFLKVVARIVAVGSVCLPLLFWINL